MGLLQLFFFSEVECVCCTLRDGETWPVKKENKSTLQRAKMRMVRSMCDVKVTERFTRDELRERLVNRSYNYSDTAA